jgi:hypothetical protein
VPAVEVPGVTDIEMAHEFGKIPQWRFHQQMEMVVHEDIGVEYDRVDVQGLGENTQKCFAVVIIPEDVSSLISAARDMVHSAWILDAQLSGHIFFYRELLVLSTIKI